MLELLLGHSTIMNNQSHFFAVCRAGRVGGGGGVLGGFIPPWPKHRFSCALSQLWSL